MIAFEIKKPEDSRAGCSGAICLDTRKCEVTPTMGYRHPILLLAVIVSLLPLPAASLDRDGARQGPGFEWVRTNPSVNGERRQVMRFDVDGLVQYALVLWPPGERPSGGWPVLQFNHGYHPNPPDYGRNSEGRNDRPGDYYREVAQAFVDRGFVVLVPDYRGHNLSAGYAFTQREDAVRYYSRDAVAAFRSLESLEGLDRDRRYMLGHSMGGLVTLAALEVLGTDVTAASIWSTMALPAGAGALGKIQVPLLLQHARGDATTAVSGSEAMLRELRQHGVEADLHLYASDDHLFEGDDFLAAVQRDLAWFDREGN